MPSIHLSPEEIFLIIEVADSSLEKDRQAKLPLYAEARIPEYWIIKLEQRELEVYQAPSNNKYLSKRIFLPDSEAPAGTV